MLIASENRGRCIHNSTKK